MTSILDPTVAGAQSAVRSAQLVGRMAEARALLARHWGFSDFRPAQRRVVQSILAGRDTLAILPTGGGKSLCFQVPALVLDGLTIVVSPLLALMQDQVNALLARGVSAASLNSLLKAPQQAEVMERVRSGELKLLYVSPERLDRLAGDLATARISPVLLAVDEAHCVAEWGHDFRPAYRKLGRLRWKLGKPQVVALTGSATAEVRHDIASTLRLGAWGTARGKWDLHLGSFDRPNLWFGAVPVRSERDRWERLLALLQTEDRTALVYVPTRGLAEGIARGLSARGIAAAPFHAGLPVKDRKETLRRFLDDEVEVVVATCAFGMGIDKPTVRLVVHWTLPPTPESYYQEAGRAGRDGRFARCVLLHHSEDAELHRRQLDVTFPDREVCERVWYERHGAARVTRSVRDSAERLRRELHPERGGVDWRPIAERRARALRRLESIARYSRAPGCLRAALISYFGESVSRCAGCAHCRGGVSEPPPDPAARARFRALRTAVAPLKAPWGSAVLEPEVLARLAIAPPVDAATLAAVPGVGPELTARFGGRILAALGVEVTSDQPATPGSGRHAALLAWRATRARAEGVEPWQVLLDGVLDRLAVAPPCDLSGLAVQAQLGPRALNAFGEELLALLREAPTGGAGSDSPS
jgi:ATP-dependent DNA helicase RecQ